jgi:dTDP-4-dehydrorhamnose reductase
MKCIVLGADGMLGHQVVRFLVAAGHDPVATTRNRPEGLVADALTGVQVITGVDVRQSDRVVSILGDVAASAVINCVGIVKQRKEAKDPLESIRINSLFPHELAALCRVAGARLIHVSTDCVFSGQKGNYREDETPDPIDLYGRTKLLGEVGMTGAITLRTSIIGLELGRKESLVEWFLSRSGTVKGWTKALYSGVTTFELARVVVRLLEDFPDLDGVWHVSAEPIDKYDLLCRLRDAVRVDVQIEPDAGMVIDRTLDSARFRLETGWTPPDWSTMVTELAEAVRRREPVQRV